MRIREWQRWSGFLLLICATAAVWGQAYTGSIAGTVRDPSGAVVPKANITVTDAAKGFTYQATTDNSGMYSVRNLPPSTYTVRVTATGFTPFERPNVVLDVNGAVNADASLQVATAGQTVTVSETGPTQLQTEDAVTGQTLNRMFINDLPLINRAVFDLAFLAPGVSQSTGNAYGSGNMANNFVSDGERNAQSDILIDGVSNTTYEQNTGFVTPLYTPSVDAVQEFRVQQTNFSAEIGFSAGTVVNVVTRSGSNQTHGSLYDFFRNTDLNANSFFNNRNGVPTSSYHYNDFGGTIGGPILKNRLFYFFDYDGSRQITPTSGTFGVPSAAERTGNFGELCGDKGGTFNASGLCSVQSGQLYDPYSAVGGAQAAAVGNPTGGFRTAYIPFNNLATYASPDAVKSPAIAPGVRGNLINPIALKVMSFFPSPNTGGAPGTPSYQAGANWYGSASNTNNGNQYDIKFDTRITDKDQLSVRFSQVWGNSLGANLFGNGLDANTQGPNTSLVYSSALNYTHTFNPTTLLTATAGYDHSWSDTGGVGAEFPGDNPAALGFSPAVSAQLTQSGIVGPPAFIINNYNSENGNANIGGQPYSGLLYGRDVYHFMASVAHTAGNHDLHIGGEYRVHRINFQQFGPSNGLFTFNQSGTSQYNSIGGDSMASFLTGFATGWSAYEIPAAPATQNLQFAGFIQDNWHVNDRLTLNLGVRYDVDKPRTERYNRMSFFDLNAPSPLAGTPGVPATGSFEYVGMNGYNRAPYDTFYGAIGPRFGFAYRIGQNNTIRGGYGIYYDPSKLGAAGTGSGGAGFLGYDATTSFSSYQGDNITPALILGQPLSIGQVIGNSQGVLTNLAGSLNGIPIRQWDVLPSEQSWSFGIERQLPWNILIDAEYVGRKGSHLYVGGDTYALDHLNATIANQFRANPASFNATVPSPPALDAAVAKLAGYTNPLADNATWQAYNSYLPYPQYPNNLWGSSGLQNVDPPWGNSIYNSFQLRVEKRFSKGLQFLFTYTGQKSIDDSSIAGSNVYINGTAGATLAQVQDPNNLHLERSLSQFDISQIVQFSWVYQLPVGKNKAFGANWNGFVDAIFGGWQLNGIYRWDTGLPLILYLNGGTNLPMFGNQRPNDPYQLQMTGGASPDYNYFSNAPLTQAQMAAWIPPPYYDGNAPRVMPNLRAPGTNNLTASLFKSFPLGFHEGSRLEFRAEAFNVLNRVQFGAPSTTINGSTPFGVINSQANSPRELQLALKLYF